MYMKVYEAVFNENTEGVYALSVVFDPAMQDHFIALSEQTTKIELQSVDEEKRLLMGAALIPNKKIYRNIDGNEFYLTFKEDTIEKLAHNFMQNQNNNNSSLEHELKLEGMSVVEAWVVEDPNNDKSNAYGKTYEKGTWVTMMKVDNDEIWEKAKNGEVQGFSIDAMLQLKEINLNTNNMNEEAKKSFLSEIKEDIKALFSSAKEEVVETEQPEIEQIEVQSEEVVEETIEEPKFDAEAFARELKETLSVEFKNQLDEVNKNHAEEVEALKVELNKQPVEEKAVLTPETKIELNENKINKREGIKSRVFESLAQNFF